METIECKCDKCGMGFFASTDCIDLEIQETNKGTYSKSMSFNLSLQFAFELSNDPFRV